MTTRTLQDHLDGWAGSDPLRRDVATTVLALANAGRSLAELLSAGPLAGAMAQVRGYHTDGDSQKELDVVADEMVRDALRAAPVALLGSEEMEEPIELNPAGTLAVAVDPLDGSSNIDTNLSVGTIFTVLPHIGADALLQPGSQQLAAGFLLYGPQVALALTLGMGTHLFVLDRPFGQFRLIEAEAQVPAETSEYAINSSNARHWDRAVRSYVEDCLTGSEGPRDRDFNTRWVASMVADAYRILVRGGIYLYPGDARRGYGQGRLRLVYEANPIAFLMEQAQGAATDGLQRILDIVPESLHQRVPLVFGSRGEVERVSRYNQSASNMPERSPLFGRRGLLRA
ncbi:class 1 fructose-bisphosphatase [Ancylobacter pratisalsi]|uniref:Fructose-1,6-bisphosphatase class 1 n=1 Tax=Ancylobacter pratisalsi TaxID=1745854 RepID=A0A6P1YKC4_9HYPH|nr:class 1 fructose-bisphosphatase [Ancylobacter pratisalsi]QIB33612.1 class 1 fructose-bisphosphatase [Ancylobacter pratisalsi]